MFPGLFNDRISIYIRQKSQTEAIATWRICKATIFLSNYFSINEYAFPFIWDNRSLLRELLFELIIYQFRTNQVKMLPVDGEWRLGSVETVPYSSVQFIVWNAAPELWLCIRHGMEFSHIGGYLRNIVHISGWRRWSCELRCSLQKRHQIQEWSMKIKQ